MPRWRRCRLRRSEQTGLLEPRGPALDDAALIREHRHELRVIDGRHEGVGRERLVERGARFRASAKMTEHVGEVQPTERETRLLDRVLARMPECELVLAIARV